MLYLIAITLSLLGGFVAGVLFARKHAERLKATESEGKRLLDALKGK
jgi:positive regulator of sigma E activity